MAQVVRPLPHGYVRIVNPKKPGEWLILHERDFDSAKHTKWSPPAKLPPGTLGGPPVPPTDGSAVVAAPPASEPPAAASERRAPTRDEVLAYLAARDAGTPHDEACRAIWPDMDAPAEPSAAELDLIRASVQESVAGPALGTDVAPTPEPAAAATPKKGKKKGGNDLSAYDSSIRR